MEIELKPYGVLDTSLRGTDVRRRSFFQKYFTGLLLVLFLSILTVGLFSTWTMSRFSREDSSLRQQEYVQVMSHLIPTEGFAGMEEAQNFVDSATSSITLRITLIDIDGTVLADSHANALGLDNHNNRKEVIVARNNGVGVSRRYSDSLREDYLYTAAYHESSGQVLRISMAVSNIEKQAMKSYIRVILVSLLILGAALWMTYNQAQSISQMLHSLQITVEDYSRRDFSRSLHLQGFSEAVSLSHAVNTMGSELKQTIAQILQEKEKSQAMLDNMSEPVLRLDQNLHILEANPSALRLSGVELENCKNKNLIQVFRSIELCNIAEESLETTNGISRLIHWKEEGRYLQVHTGILKKEEDDNLTLLLVMNDVTEIKELELMRKDFVGNVSHELRTPVTSIVGFAQNLVQWKDMDPERVDQFVKIVSAQSSRLASIIEDLLSLSLIEEDNSNFKQESILAADVMDAALEVCRIKAEENDIEISMNKVNNPAFWGHRNLVEQALVNFLDNAIKYSPSGTTVNFFCNIQQGRVEFHVQDQGPGISPEAQHRIFERFYRIDKARSRDVGGTGLGLSIVKHIAQKLGGEVGLSSSVGQGCDFHISFQAADSDIN